MSTCQKIVELLKAEGYKCPADVRIARTRAGCHQRSAGAWSWFLTSNTVWPYSNRIGSQWPAKAIARGFTMYTHLGDVHLDPINSKD